VDERNLRLRLSEYENHWQVQDEDSVWNLLSPRLRTRQSNDLPRFKEAIRKTGETLTQLDAQDIQISDSNAVVRAQVTFHALAGGTRKETEEQYWVKQSGEWRFDGCKVVEGGARVGWDAH
jgi:hypothetical protein